MAKRRLTQRQREQIQRLQAQRRDLGAPQTDLVENMGLGPKQGGLVVAHYGQTLIVEDATSQLHRCAARQNLGRLACGDRIIWQAATAGDGVVIAIDERRSLLTRPDYNGQPRPVAANLDAVVVVMAPTPPPSDDLIDRYLVAIAAIGLQSLLVLNKLDLLDTAELEPLTERLAVYSRIGYPVSFISCHTGQGLEALRTWLRGHSSLLVGQSGVGKSSLIKALLPERQIRIQAVSAATGHGSHTTSASTLYHLPGGGDLIDSPGVRSFELTDIQAPDLDRGFPELAPYLGHCRFSDCSHTAEPGCALQAAALHGAIATRRLDSYRQLRASLGAPKSGRSSA